MRDTNLDLFDPRTAVMESSPLSSSAASPTGGRDPNFAFAFNERNFSDRVLLMEVLAEEFGGAESGDEEGGVCQSIPDWARQRKRPMEDFTKQHALDIAVCPEEQLLNSDQPDADDILQGENQDVEEFALIEESPSGDEAANSDDSNCDMGSSRVLGVRKLHISSPILESPFFYKTSL